jgi:hypothetical protein
MDRRDVLASLGLGALAAPTTAEPRREERARLKGVPVVTVEELAAAIRKEGFQGRFIGRQITFMAVVLTAGTAPRVRIEGMDPGKLDTAALHHGGSETSVQVGQRLKVRGLIVDQWYGVWQVWQYDWAVVES